MPTWLIKRAGTSHRRLLARRGLPHRMPAVVKHQSEASYEFDAKVHAWLVSKAPSDREAQRLRRCAQPHASGFITALPSEEDGRDTILKPRNFRIAVAYRLGVPVIDS